MIEETEHDLGCPTAISMQDYGLMRRVNQISKYVNIKNNRILDVGCGNGLYSLKFGDLGAEEVIGIDIEPERLKNANDFKVNYKNVKFFCLSVENLPFADSYFNVVLLVDVLEHILHPEMALKEINRVLRKGGTIVLFAPNKWWIYDQHGMRIGNKVISRPLFFSWFPDIVRKKFERAPVFIDQKLVKLLQDNGFIVSNIDYLFPEFDKIKNVRLKVFFRRVSFFAEKHFKKFGHSIFVMGEKK